MTLVIPSSRFAELLADAERAIEQDGFVVLQYADSEPVPSGAPGGFQQAGGSGHCVTGDRHLLAPARVATASPPSPSPPAPVRAPYLRREQIHRRRGAWLEWQEPPRPTPWRRWIVLAVWAWLAVHVAAWWLR